MKNCDFYRASANYTSFRDQGTSKRAWPGPPDTKQNMDAVEINTSESPQNEEGIVSAMEICRVCLLGNVLMRDLFHDNGIASLSAKAMSFTSIKVRDITCEVTIFTFYVDKLLSIKQIPHI